VLKLSQAHLREYDVTKGASSIPIRDKGCFKHTYT